MARKRKRDSKGRYAKENIFTLLADMKSKKKEPQELKPVKGFARFVLWFLVVTMGLVTISMLFQGAWFSAIIPGLIAFVCFSGLQKKEHNNTDFETSVPEITYESPTEQKTYPPSPLGNDKLFEAKEVESVPSINEPKVITTSNFSFKPILTEYGYTDPYSIEDTWEEIICNIAGSQYHDADEVRGFIRKGCKFDLIPDPENQYDTCAVKIMFKDKMVGFIPSDYSFYVSEAIDEGSDLKVELLSQNSKETDYHRYKIKVYR